MLIEIKESEYKVDINLIYATNENFTGIPVYKRPICYLHEDAAKALLRASQEASSIGLKLVIFDALRPTEAQWKLWNHTPDPNFLANPERGSPHSRGVAIDLSLLDQNGNQLEMGTEFDAFTPLSHHGNKEISIIARKNRLLLLGIMTSAGWDYYKNEWWHYQLFESRKYPLINDEDVPQSIMM